MIHAIAASTSHNVTFLGWLPSTRHPSRDCAWRFSKGVKRCKLTAAPQPFGGHIARDGNAVKHKGPPGISYNSWCSRRGRKKLVLRAWCYLGSRLVGSGKFGPWMTPHWRDQRLDCLTRHPPASRHTLKRRPRRKHATTTILRKGPLAAVCIFPRSGHLCIARHPTAACFPLLTTRFTRRKKLSIRSKRSSVSEKDVVASLDETNETDSACAATA